MPGGPIDVFILGSVFSGSTVIGNALGIHPEAFFAGEVAALPAYSEAYQVMHAIDGCLGCAALGRPCPVWTRERIDRVIAAGPAGYLSGLRDDVGRRVIVDGSKLVGWFRVVGAAGGLDRERVRVIVTSKDPFAFADSLMRRTKGPAWQAANVWRDTYFDILRTLHASRFLYTHVAYAELCRDPEATLRQICAVCDLDFDARMLDLRSASSCSIGGNPGAHVWRPGMIDAIERKREWSGDVETRHYESYRERGLRGGWTDDKWTERIGPGALTAIVQTPGLGDLAALLGYDLVDLARRV